MSETAEPLLNVQRTSPVVGGETSDARKASKKAKKAKKDVHKDEGAQRHTAGTEPAFSATVNEPKNRKHKVLDQGNTEDIRGTRRLDGHAYRIADKDDPSPSA